MKMVTLAGRRPAIAAILAAYAASFLCACGSSSTTQSSTAPTPVKCAIQAQPDSATFPFSGGSATVRVSTNRECQWSAKSDTAWMTLASPTDGQGEGSFQFTVTSNADPSSRTGNITVNDQHVSISQDGKPCEFTLSSTHQVVDGSGGDWSIDVRASAAQCAWTAAANVPWISILSAREGRGNGSVRFHVDPTSGPPRVGTVTVAGQTVQIEQGTGCTYAIDADTFVLDGSGGERQIAVTAPAGCSWTAESRTSWISISGGSTGTGSGAVTFRVQPTDGPERSGALIVAGHPVTITQGQGCTFTVTPTNITVAAAGGPSAIQVQSGSGCSWSAVSDSQWISFTAGASGNGSGAVQIAIAANTGPGRNGSVTIAGHPVTISQGQGCTFAVTPANISIAAAGGPGVIQVQSGSGCGWSAASDALWIAVTSGANGSGSGQVQINVAGNTGPARNGSVTVSGHAVTIAQANGCTYSVASAPQDVAPAGGSVGATISTGQGCPWTASSSADWINAASTAGSGPSQVTFTVAPNGGPPRSGGITVAGQAFTIAQASACTWTFAPPATELPREGGAGNVLVILNGVCTWTATTTTDWIQITGGSSGTGNGLLQFLVGPNGGPPRTGTVTIGGQQYLIRQAGQ